MSYEKKDFILFGGDYSPEQWGEKTVEKDLELLVKAGINTLTLPVFSWAKLEPEEGNYNFAWLDDVLNQAEERGLHYFLSTPTSAQPAWMSRKYPEILPVDIEGRKRTHGMRVYFCVNSEVYRERAAAIAREMGRRYGGRKGLLGWHVANEYGTYCYCENCQKRFRTWLQKRYGTIEELNERWNTSFWGRTVYDFEEIMLPTQQNDDYRFQPAVQLDYMRFMTDSTLECYENEASILKKISPQLPVFSNISGFIKKLDQFKMVSHMDLAGWDNYPSPFEDRSLAAMKHDIMRACSGGDSYYVVEQSPNQQNWQPYNKLKRPGEIRRLACQGLAHGADSSLYFQMHQSLGGQEKFHGAIIGRSGEGNTRIYQEISALGEELQRLGDRFIGGRFQSEVGILFDWENWWALELTSGPSKDMDYLQEVWRYYRPFYEKNILVDFVRYEDDLSPYKLLIAPMLYMIKDGVEERIASFVHEGGVLLATYMTGYADENDRCCFGVYPGPLRKVLGLWVEETDALAPWEKNSICIEGEEECYESTFLCDIIHMDTAEAKAVYGKDFYKGYPCVTTNSYGKGAAWYLATRPGEEYLRVLCKELCCSCNIHSVFETEGEIEVTRRERDGKETYFVINHGSNPGRINLKGQKYRNLLKRGEESSEEVLSGETGIDAGDVWVLAVDEI